MENVSTTHWMPALIVLALGLVGGALMLLLRRRTVAAEGAHAATIAEQLQRRLEQLMEQLRELETEKHLLLPADFATQKEKLEVEAAQALQARDAPRPALTQPAAPPPSVFLARYPQLKGALWGGGVVLFFVALFLILNQEDKPRTDMPPQPNAAAGGTPPMAAASAASDAELKSLQQRLEQAPDDIEANARAAHLLLKRQDLDNAEELTYGGLSLDPFHGETRVHRALLRVARGDAPGGEAELQRLAVTYPHAQEADLYLGMLRLQSGDKRGALNAFDRYLQETPGGEHPPMLTSTVASLRAEIEGKE